MTSRKSAAGNPDVQVELLHRMNASDSKLFTPTAVGSDGHRLFINSRFKFYRSDAEGLLSEVVPSRSLNNWSSGWVVTSDALWAYGSGGITCSLDDGASFTPVKLTWRNALRSMAIAPDGSLWAGDDAVVLRKPPGEQTFAAIAGAAPPVTAMASSRLGVLVGDRNGRLWIGVGSALKATALKADAPVRTILETDRGTLLVLGVITRTACFLSYVPC